MARLKKEFEEMLVTTPVTEPVEPKVKQYCAKIRLYHPYQNLYIDNSPVYVAHDSWLQSQIEAGLVYKV